MWFRSRIPAGMLLALAAEIPMLGNVSGRPLWHWGPICELINSTGNTKHNLWEQQAKTMQKNAHRIINYNTASPLLLGRSPGALDLKHWDHKVPWIRCMQVFLHFTTLWMVVFPLSPSTACCSPSHPHTGLLSSSRATKHPQTWWVRSDLHLQSVAFACASSEGALSLSSCSSLSIASQENSKTLELSCAEKWGTSHFPAEMRAAALWHTALSITVHHSRQNCSFPLQISNRNGLEVKKRKQG